MSRTNDNINSGITVDHMDLLENLGTFQKLQNEYYPTKMPEIEYFVKTLFPEQIYQNHYDNDNFTDSKISDDVLKYGLQAFRADAKLSEREECEFLIKWINKMIGKNEDNFRNKQLILSFTLSEIIRMCRLECNERANILLIVWEEILKMMKKLEKSNNEFEKFVKKDSKLKIQKLKQDYEEKFIKMKQEICEFESKIPKFKEEIQKQNDFIAQLKSRIKELSERCQALSGIIDHLVNKNVEDLRKSAKSSKKNIGIVLTRLKQFDKMDLDAILIPQEKTFLTDEQKIAELEKIKEMSKFVELPIIPSSEPTKNEIITEKPTENLPAKIEQKEEKNDTEIKPKKKIAKLKKTFNEYFSQTLTQTYEEKNTECEENEEFWDFSEPMQFDLICEKQAKLNNSVRNDNSDFESEMTKTELNINEKLQEIKEDFNENMGSPASKDNPNKNEELKTDNFSGKINSSSHFKTLQDNDTPEIANLQMPKEALLLDLPTNSSPVDLLENLKLPSQPEFSHSQDEITQLLTSSLQNLNIDPLKIKYISSQLFKLFTNAEPLSALLTENNHPEEILLKEQNKKTEPTVLNTPKNIEPHELRTSQMEELQTELPKKLMAVMSEMTDNISNLDTDEYGQWLLDLTKDNELTRRILSNGHTLTILLRNLYKTKNKEQDMKKLLENVLLYSVSVQTERIFKSAAEFHEIQSLNKEIQTESQEKLSPKMTITKANKNEGTEKQVRIVRKMASSRDVQSSHYGFSSGNSKQNSNPHSINFNLFQIGKIQSSLGKAHPALLFLQTFLEKLASNDTKYLNVATLSVKLLLKNINNAYAEKLITGRNIILLQQQPLIAFLFDSFINKYGLLNFCERKLKEIMLTAIMNKTKYSKIELFARFVGISEVKYSPDDLWFFLYFAQKLFTRVYNVVNAKRDIMIFENLNSANIEQIKDTVFVCFPNVLPIILSEITNLTGIISLDFLYPKIIDAYRQAKISLQEKLVSKSAILPNLQCGDAYYDLQEFCEISKVCIWKGEDPKAVFEKYATYQEGEHGEIVRKIGLEILLGIIVRNGIEIIN